MSKLAIFDLRTPKQQDIDLRELYGRKSEFSTKGVIDTGLCKIYEASVIRKQ